MDIFEQLVPSLKFATLALEEGQFPPPLRRVLLEKLNALRQRFILRKAIISVVGEFSAGKSSFLNALLGMDLLDVDELPDTTLVPAIINYSPVSCLQIIRRDGDGPIEILDIEGIRRRLREYAMPESDGREYADEQAYIDSLERARAEARRRTADIVSFNIGLPSEFLSKGFTLIDTPGISSANERCAEMAKYHMEHSDCSIIVAEATRGVLQESLRERFSDFIGTRLEHCMVVFTRYDLTSPSRREKVRTYLETTTPAFFNMTAVQMPVFMTVPPTVAAERHGSRFGSDHDEMLRLTRESLLSIERVALERREFVMARTMRQLFDDIYSFLQEDIRRRRDHSVARMEKLKLSRTVSLTEFIEKQATRCVRKLRVAKAEALQDLETKIEDDLTSMRKDCDNEIFVKRLGPVKLREFLKTGLTTRIQASVAPLNRHVEDAQRLFFIKQNEEILRFNNELKKEFSRLDVIPVPPVAVTGISSGGIAFDTSATEMMKLHLNDQMKDDFRELTGAVIGGIIGSVVTLGFGTVIGAGLGAAFFSRGDKNGIEGFRERIKPQYEKEMDNVAQQLRSRTLNSFGCNADEVINRLESHIRNYDKLYHAEIDRLIEEEHLRVCGIKSEIAGLEKKLEEIKQHRIKINEICKTN